MSNTIGQVIRLKRKEREWSVYDLAERVLGRRDLQSTVSNWETGKRSPSAPNLVKLAEVFSCSTDELLGVTPKVTPILPDVGVAS